MKCAHTMARLVAASASVREISLWIVLGFNKYIKASELSTPQRRPPLPQPHPARRRVHCTKFRSNCIRVFLLQMIIGSNNFQWLIIFTTLYISCVIFWGFSSAVNERERRALTAPHTTHRRSTDIPYFIFDINFSLSHSFARSQHPNQIQMESSFILNYEFRIYNFSLRKFVSYISAHNGYSFDLKLFERVLVTLPKLPLTKSWARDIYQKFA